MKNVVKAILHVVVLVGAIAHPAQSQVWPQTVGGMKHVLIALDGTSIDLELDPTPGTPTPPLELRDFGESHTAPADVLDGRHYNDQYGFLPDGFISLPADNAIWIRMIAHTPGMEFHEGGMRPMKASHTYDPIFTTAGSSDIWRQGPNMAHHWVTATAVGDYDATFEIYVGHEDTGAPLGGYGSDQITLSWTLPEPRTAGLLILGGLLMRRRRDAPGTKFETACQNGEYT